MYPYVCVCDCVCVCRWGTVSVLCALGAWITLWLTFKLFTGELLSFSSRSALSSLYSLSNPLLPLFFLFPFLPPTPLLPPSFLPPSSLPPLSLLNSIPSPHTYFLSLRIHSIITTSHLLKGKYVVDFTRVWSDLCTFHSMNSKEDGARNKSVPWVKHSHFYWEKYRVRSLTILLFSF